MNKDLKQEFARLHTRLDTIEAGVASTKSEVLTLKSDLATLQYTTAVEFRAVRSDLAVLVKNPAPLGDLNEAADL